VRVRGKEKVCTFSLKRVRQQPNPPSVRRVFVLVDMDVDGFSHSRAVVERFVYVL
jgi:hypothetical protein